MFTRQEKLLLLVLACVQFTHIVDFMILMPLGPELFKIFQIDAQQFGLIISAYTLSAGVSGFLASFVIDRFDRKTVLLGCYTGFMIGTFACALAPNYILLMMARCFAGFFGGVCNAIILAIIGDAIPFQKRGTAMGVVMAAFSVASVFGVPMGLFLANLMNWHMPFYALTALCLITIVLSVLYIPSMRGHMLSQETRPSPIQVLRNVSSDSNQIRALLFSMCLVFSQFAMIPYISPYMVSNVGFTNHDLTYIYFLGGFATIFSSPMVGRLSDKKGKLRVFYLFAVLSLIPIIGITHMPKTHMAIALIVTTSCFVFFNGRFIPALALITSAAPTSQRGSFMSINSSAQQIASGLSSFIAGTIMVTSSTGELIGYDLVGYMCVVFTCLSLYLGRSVVSREVIITSAPPPDAKISEAPV